jgi:hypothetical protein
MDAASVEICTRGTVIRAAAQGSPCVVGLNQSHFGSWVLVLQLRLRTRDTVGVVHK